MAALDSYQILDTLPEEDYNTITRLAAYICQTPLALITFVDDRRQWFKSAYGIEASETPLEHGFCAHAVANPQENLIVNDARKDARFRDNALVKGDPNIVFYAGVPIVDEDGHALGSVCVIDKKSRQLNKEQISALEDLTRQLVNLLKLRKANAALLREEHQFRTFADNLQNLAWIADADGWIFWYNQRWYDYTGTTLEEMQGWGWQKVHHPDHVDRVVADTSGFWKKDKPFELLFPLRSKEGPYRWFLTRAVPVFDKAGKIDQWIGTNTDVHGQVENREALARSEARFRSLIGEAPFPTALYTGEKLIIEMANAEMVRLWGREESVVGKPLEAALPELEGQPFIGLLQEVYRSGISYNAHAQPADLMVDGKLTRGWYNFTYKPLKNPAGEVYAILNMAVDVTTQVAAAQQLETSEKVLAGAVELAELATWNIDAATRKVFYSPRLQQWLGLEGGIALENAIVKLCDEDQERVAGALAYAMDKESNGRFDEIYTVTDSITGNKRIIHSLGLALRDKNGDVLSLAGTAQDVTAQKDLQAALENEVRLRTEELAATVEELAATNEELAESNEHLLRSNTELTQYAYVASHDLQEPLRKIRMFTDLLNKRTEPDTVSSPLIRKIDQSATRMSQLINDLLNFSRLLNTHEVYQAVDLNAILRNVLIDFELKIEESEAMLHIGNMPAIEAIGLQMNQLFYNLLSNALKFAAPGRKPVIRIDSEVIATAEAAPYFRKVTKGMKYYRINFADNGIGFAAEHAERIFEVFKRLHGKEQYQGSGIGLALCRRIAANHQGALFTTSTESEGATFTIILPERQQPSV